MHSVQSVQFSCSVVSDSATPWTAAHQASLSITNSWSLLKLMSIVSIMPSSHLILCRPLLLPSSKFLSLFLTQFSSVTQSCSTLCDPMDCSTPGFPVHHQLLELAQTHDHRVGDAIQPSHPPLSPFSSCLQSFPASGSFQMSQFFASGGQSIGVSASASVLPMIIQD